MWFSNILHRSGPPHREPAQGKRLEEACWGRDPEKFCAPLFLSRLSLHSKVMQCTAKGSQKALAPQTLCSPEIKTESPHLCTHRSPCHLGSRPPKWLFCGFTSAGPGEVSFKVVLWMGQDFVIGSGREDKEEMGETRKQ